MAPIITSPGLGRTAGSPGERTCVPRWGGCLDVETLLSSLYHTGCQPSQEALATSWDRLKAEYWWEAAALWRQQKQTTHKYLVPASTGPWDLRPEAKRARWLQIPALNPVTTFYSPSILQEPCDLGLATWLLPLTRVPQHPPPPPWFFSLPISQI